MSRLTKKTPSLCTDLPLNNPDILYKFKVLSQLFRSCFGPTGRLKQIHNNIGGHVITTSTSSVLLQALSSQEPLIKLIAASIMNHVSRFSDCGLFTAILCFSLIDQVKQSGLRVNVAINVNKHLLGMCTSYLHEEECGCKETIDFNSSQNLITLARSVISSKPACGLTEKELLHISTLEVKAFLMTVPCVSPGTVILGRIVTVSVEGHPVLDSTVFPGLLVEIPDILTNITFVQSHTLKMVLFSASLSGDIFELGDGTLEVYRGVDAESQILDQLLELGKQVVKDEVKLFVCQKVIHPVLQHYLRRNDIMVIERLGVAFMEPLTKLTGAQPVAMFQTPVPPGAYGHVRGLSVRHFGSKRMLQLQTLGEPVICTMVLCHRNETMLNELKVACQKTEHVLRLTLKEPYALYGGGCTETHLAAYIRNKSLTKMAEATEILCCSESEYLLGTAAFCRSLESVAQALDDNTANSLIDLTHAHHWSVPADVAQVHRDSVSGACGCGLVENMPGEKWTYLNSRYSNFCPAPLSTKNTSQPRVLDPFIAKFNALQVAVETANLVLDIRYIIQDTN